MRRDHSRVPRVLRLDYLIAFLESYNGKEFDEEQAQKSIQKLIYEFELKKAKALGKQAPRTYKGTSTLQECLTLATQLGLVDRFHRLTPDASRVLDSSQRRNLLLERIWDSYPPFRQVVLTARDLERLDLPLRKEVGSLYKLGLDRFNFEAIRSLATDLDLINWYPTEQRRQIVYPVTSVVSFAEIFCLVGLPIQQTTLADKCRHKTALDLNLVTVQDGRYELKPHAQIKTEGYIVLHTGGDQLFVKDRDVSDEDFEQALWREYLDLSNMRSRFPVLYPNLRNKSCAALGISDRCFDQHVLYLIREPQRLNIFPSGGVLNYEVNLARFAKFLPPTTSQGNFIIYLKIERKN